ncbi:hypothetical protein SAM40697_2130 [Streptomyces ambofaciens]|uniref:Type A2 lantipeptide n=1 Tax=Streptomyces ambofaciens TaxID=1889 RepID=A0ABM6AXE2_STRAM|nr:hypothetical protein [Streptomyces ambofaciens]ANB06090.1 hypothetical protein SAM40697_2130 [Streptomyces ambofaciens]
MNLVPQVETADISDADLDQVSGGLTVSTALVTGGGAVGAGLYAEAGPFAVSAGLGAAAPLADTAAQGHAHTTMV